MPVFRLIAAKPSLLPLMLCVGGMYGTSLTFVGRNLTSSPDVVVKKSYESHPWNAVSQGYNSKLFSFNPEFWLGRASLPDPRAAFLQDAGNPTATSIAKVKKARKYKKSKKELSTSS